MLCTLLLDSDEAHLHYGDASINTIPLDDDAYALLKDYTRRYQRLVKTQGNSKSFRKEDEKALLVLGQDLFGWLDGEEEKFTQVFREHTGKLFFEVRTNTPGDICQTVWAGLNAPWELLANKDGFLAENAKLKFSPVRRLGRPQGAPPLDDNRLGLLFMAAEPRGQKVLDYEREEAAIIRAVGKQDIDLVVDESGSPEILGKGLGKNPVQVLHLSCHGRDDFPTGPDAAPTPVLMLEDDTGDEKPTTASDLADILDANCPHLVFLSACLSAAQGKSVKNEDDKDTPQTPVVHSLCSEMVESGIPSLLGWDGSVHDRAATVFAEKFYHHLSVPNNTIQSAASIARRAMLNSGEAPVRAHWHLARLWLGPTGGGAVVGGTTARFLHTADAGYQTFLDKKQQVPVANLDEFVGRRRELQKSIAAIRLKKHAGVLLHGMGRQGKSSLAARIANRLPEYHLVVVFGKYKAHNILQEIKDAYSNDNDVQDIVDNYETTVLDKPEKLQNALNELLNGPCQTKPMLLVLDDLEQILGEESRAKQPVDPAHVPVLKAVLQAFSPQHTNSRVLLTSRFPFTLGGMEDKLRHLEIPSFEERARNKILWRQQNLLAEYVAESSHPFTDTDDEQRRPLLQRAADLSLGNPGLQDLFGKKVVLSKQMPIQKSKEVLGKAESWLKAKEKEMPDHEDVRAFFSDLAVEALIKQAGETSRILLQACLIFQLPVPEEVVIELQKYMGGDVAKLRGLGLFDVYPDVVNHKKTAFRVAPLCAGSLEKPKGTAVKQVIDICFQFLCKCWMESSIAVQRVAYLELVRLATIAEDLDFLAQHSTCAINYMSISRGDGDALEFGFSILSLFDGKSYDVPLSFLAQMARCACKNRNLSLGDELYLKVKRSLKEKDKSCNDESREVKRLLCLYKGDKFLHEGKSVEAEIEYNKALVLAKKDRNFCDIGSIHLDIASVYDSRSEYATARNTIQKYAIPAFRDAGDFSMLDAAYNKY